MPSAMPYQFLGIWRGHTRNPSSLVSHRLDAPWLELPVILRPNRIFTRADQVFSREIASDGCLGLRKAGVAASGSNECALKFPLVYYPFKNDQVAARAPFFSFIKKQRLPRATFFRRGSLISDHPSLDVLVPADSYVLLPCSVVRVGIIACS